MMALTAVLAELSGVLFALGLATPPAAYGFAVVMLSGVLWGVGVRVAA